MASLDPDSTAPQALTQARRQDVARRRQRVHQALAELRAQAEEITISAVARRAGVHRSFIHRHPDLRATVLQAADGDPPGDAPSAGASRRSLLADNANLREQNRRLAQQLGALEDRLSETLGAEAFRRSGLAAPPDTAAFQARVEQLQQQVLDLQRALEERDEELAAAREAHRRLMAEVNRAGGEGT
jgi:DNA repair exonuclease SbcCD ATPase subunit